jgi:hypothetical protein
MKASPQSSRPAVGVLDLDAIFLIQLTVGVLSQSIPKGSCVIAGASARMTPTPRTSAASYRSELVSRPLELSNDTTLSDMLHGNRSLHTTGCISCANKNHTLPAPSAAALWYPAYRGISTTNSRTWVGRDPSSWSSKHRSSSAALISNAFPNPMTLVPIFIAALMGVKNLRAAGRMMDACRNLPTRVGAAGRMMDAYCNFQTRV